VRLDGGPEPILSDAEFRMFCELFRDHCGLSFGLDSRFLLERRLTRRLEELGLGSFAAYHYLLRSDTSGDRELSYIVDEITTNETYFFRERNQLRALMEEILPPLAERRKQQGGVPISIWSAGCSSGEEPYSIVMLAIEAGLVPGQDLRVYASDISRKMLQKARRGEYRPASFRETEPAFQKKYFEERGALWRINDDVKRHVVFTHLNLLDRGRISLLGTMDVILCRNVIIYFGAETKARVIKTFEEKLRPGGHLLLGHSESLINITNAFELRHLRHDLVYRRPVPGEGADDPWHAAAHAAIVGAGPDGGAER
jgi:chemotaxis protein methyltransferase CheR